ncbi:hypothetical protein ALC57_07793 [Trachymyrmex cornetzi]|uniref:DNA-directed DNA polymerase n=1 Tax=Trachymyrmex cornetzi TaxID=471704 RepID=A0A151J7H9_9HYME|nr:hypothetical protein ALC57_07793 [Trachymyrmex cornetzi]
MLKHTGVKFELLTDIDMVMFVRGLSQCSNRYARSNNKYMPSYDQSKPSSYLMYYDVNNLYEGRYRAEAMIAKPNFHSRSVFSENLVAIELCKLEIKFDKPLYMGMYILDIFKTCLYEFHHEYMAPVYREKFKKDTKKAKGVKSNVVARSITFEEYKQCLNDAVEMTCRQSCIRSKLHEVYTISETKIALSSHYDKRYIVPGSTNALPWGHYQCK